MSRQLMRYVALAATALHLTGCGTPIVQPTIDKSKFAPPKTVAIVEPPRMRYHALVGVRLPNRPEDAHFSPNLDFFFAVDPASSRNLAAGTRDYALDAAMTGQQIAQSQSPTVTAGVGGALAGALVGAIFQSSIEESKNYDRDLLARMPGFDLRAEVIQALARELRNRDVQVFVITDSVGWAPRLRWAATEADAKHARQGDGNLPTVDADLLVQVSPLAAWMAAGPLNSFEWIGGVGIAIFDGRTKQFLGRQTFFPFAGAVAPREYRTYKELLDDTPTATQTLREVLLSIVPQIAFAIKTPRAPATTGSP